MIERLFFAGLVAFEMQGVAPAMITWLVAKLAANWNWPISEKADDEDRHLRIGLAFTALLAGLVSMLFALVGGLIAGGKIWYWPS